MTSAEGAGTDARRQAGDPIHVLTLTPFYPSAADAVSGCFVAEPLLALSCAGVRSSVIAVQPFYRAASFPAESFPAQWVRYPSIPSGLGLASSGRFLFGRLLPLVRSLHAEQPIRVIHAHAPLPCGHAAALLSHKLGIPFVVSVHGLDAYSTRQVHGLPGRWCMRVSRRVYHSAARVICVSGKVRQAVEQGAGAPVNTAVIYNSADSGRFFPTDGAAAEASAATVLSIGNLIPIKGHEMLMRALAQISHRFPNLRWEIVGEGPERPRLTALAASLGMAEKVHFLGRLNRDQVAEVMRRCALFALPSRYEALGCVYLEAMSAAKPVIACRGQGIEEIIEHGRNGYLVDSGDQDELAGALCLLLADGRRRAEVGAAARATILEGYTLTHQAGQLAQLYRECLA
ncbi:MAG TPA: glycosyltransferase [Terriglobales bacterium]|nr:glycosyltransferase [Terriglobales bacterium]